jgi:hypothetical protein
MRSGTGGLGGYVGDVGVSSDVSAGSFPHGTESPPSMRPIRHEETHKTSQEGGY